MKISMRSVASYSSEQVLATDKRVNLIYGLNGTGKSTVAEFLRNPKEPLYSECHLASPQDAEVLVYNRQFLREEFYEADQLRGIFGLSSKNKAVDQEIEAAETALSATRTELATAQAAAQAGLGMLEKLTEKASEQTWEIKKQYTGGDRVFEYCLAGLKRKQLLFEHLKQTPKPVTAPERGIDELRADIESLRESATSKVPTLSPVKFDGTEAEYSDLLSKPIVGNESSQVAQLIKNLRNSDWVRKGFEDYLTEPKESATRTCPFCQALTITEELAGQIEEYFDESFDDSLQRIASIQEHYQLQASQIPQAADYEQNPIAAQSLPAILLALTELQSTVKANLTRIGAKLREPSTPTSLEGTTEAAKKLNELIKETNERIAAHNERIENREEELDRLKHEFWELMRWKHDSVVEQWKADRQSTATTIKAHAKTAAALQSDVKKKQESIATLQQMTINTDAAIGRINDRLGQIGLIDFSIEKYSDIHYQIVRKESTKAPFSSLSEGEKTIISFLYFCELCRGRTVADAPARPKIAVIDDPVSSLSHPYVFNIGEILKSELFSGKACKQVFVLTHSLYFFYELTERNPDKRAERQKLFRITKSATGSQIREMKYGEIQNDYQSYWAVVLDKGQHPAMVANCMRNIVEHFFGFVENVSLPNAFQKPELRSNRFQAFRRYMDRESHSEGQNLFDHKEFDYDAFREGLNLLFKAAGYESHYNQMVKMLSTPRS